MNVHREKNEFEAVILNMTPEELAGYLYGRIRKDGTSHIKIVGNRRGAQCALIDRVIDNQGWMVRLLAEDEYFARLADVPPIYTPTFVDVLIESVNWLVANGGGGLLIRWGETPGNEGWT